MKTRFALSSLFAISLLTLGVQAFAQTGSTLAGDARRLQIGDQIRVNDDFLLNESIPDRLYKEDQSFFSHFRMSDTLLECRGFTYTMISYNGRQYGNRNVFVPKGTDLTITAIEHEDPKDSERKYKNVATFKVTIEAQSKETIADEQGTTHHMKLICERDYMASKKFRHLPIELGDIVSALSNRIEFAPAPTK